MLGSFKYFTHAIQIGSTRKGLHLAINFFFDLSGFLRKNIKGNNIAANGNRPTDYTKVIIALRVPVSQPNTSAYNTAAVFNGLQ